jgi:hypothetical protein
LSVRLRLPGGDVGEECSGGQGRCEAAAEVPPHAEPQISTGGDGWVPLSRLELWFEGAMAIMPSVDYSKYRRFLRWWGTDGG